MQPLDPESEQIKEVYARFGLAMYQAQCVERQLAVLLATEYGPGLHNMTRQQYEELLESLFKKTLGGLIHKLREAVDLPSDFESTLREALNKRNWLAHHYFWERAGHFMTEQGRRLMVDELQVIATELDELDQTLIHVSRKWMEKIGMSEEVVQIEMDRLLREANAV